MKLWQTSAPTCFQTHEPIEPLLLDLAMQFKMIPNAIARKRPIFLPAPLPKVNRALPTSPIFDRKFIWSTRKTQIRIKYKLIKKNLLWSHICIMHQPAKSKRCNHKQKRGKRKNQKEQHKCWCYHDSFERCFIWKAWMLDLDPGCVQVK